MGFIACTSFPAWVQNKIWHIIVTKSKYKWNLPFQTSSIASRYVVWHPMLGRLYSLILQVKTFKQILDCFIWFYSIVVAILNIKALGSSTII